MDNVAEVIKYGVISSIDAEKATARVTFSDRDNVVSYDLPITFTNTGFAKMYSMPKVGQPVKCSFLGTGMEDGFIDGSFYNSENVPPKTGNVHYVAFDDGALVEYDADSKIITLKSGGGGILLDDDVTVSKNLIVKNGISSGSEGGDFTITGSVTATGDITASGVSLKNHKHGGVQNGGGTTSGPQ